MIVLEGDQETPLPWANVIANPAFGTVVTASGSAYTWSENSRENRLTPFANDPVTDPTAEALFVRDDETGRDLVPHAGPDAPRGRGRPLRDPPFRRGSRASRAWPTACATSSTSSWTPKDPVKFSLLTLTNESGADAPPERLRLQRVGAGPAAGRPGRARGDRARRRDAARSWPGTPTTRSSRGAWPSPTRASRCARPRATARRSWAATGPWPSRRLFAARRCRGASAPGSIPAPRCRSP